MSESLNYIEAYFTGQLSDAEKRQFERQCEANQEFAADVAFYITSRHAVREKLLEEKRHLWADTEARPEKIATSPVTGKIMMLNRWATYAVAACLIIAVGLYFLNRPENPHQLADNYFNQTYSQLSQTMDGSIDSLQMGIALYNKQDYQKALSYFQDVYRAHPDNNDAKLYTGIVYLKLKDYDNAILQFDELATKTLKINSGLFLKAVALMQRDKGDDSKNAKVLLEQIVQTPLAGSMQAKEWLKHWEGN